MCKNESAIEDNLITKNPALRHFAQRTGFLFLKLYILVFVNL